MPVKRPRKTLPGEGAAVMIRKRGDWQGAKVGDELLMMSVESGTYLGLNDVGARIWELLDEPFNPERLCDRLIAEFNVSAERCRTELSVFLADLVRAQAVTVDSD